MTDEQIREIFLANGFTIKEGLTDLKPYVYQAAHALLAADDRPSEALPPLPTAQMYVKVWHSTEETGESLQSPNAAYYTADQMLEYAQAAIAALDRSSEDAYYIAAYHHEWYRGQVTWWGPNGAGYTPDLEQAGIYTRAEAERFIHGNDDQVLVPVSFIKNLRVRRTVDQGDSKNTMFWTSDKLREAIKAASDHPSKSGEPS
jgi:hypothetical protein